MGRNKTTLTVTKCILVDNVHDGFFLWNYEDSPPSKINWFQTCNDILVWQSENDWPFIHNFTPLLAKEQGLAP